MGFMPQQLDLSLHGMPASSGNRPFANQDPFVNQCSQLFGMSNDGTNLMTKAACFQTEKVSDPSNNFQTDHCFPEQDYSQDTISVTTHNFQGKGVMGNDTMQIFSSDVTSGNYQQVNHMQDSLQIQEFHGGQVQNVWSGNLQEKSPVHVGTSTGVSSLDPTEEKILFGTNDDDNWGASFGGSFNSFMSGYPHGHPSQSEYLGAFPSIQSGSWSALMQEAVQASSSEQVVHEEWSGLNIQKTEQPMLMRSNTFDDTVRQLAAWNDSSLLNASFSTSRLPSQTYDADRDSNLNAVPNFQHTFKSSHGNNNGVPAKVPFVSFQLSTEDKIQFLQNQEQEQYLESGLQLQTPVTNRIWTEHTHDQKENNSADVQFKSQNIVEGWNQQENVYFSTTNRQHSYGPNGSSTSSLVTPDGHGTSLIHGTDDNVWKSGASHVNPNGGMQPLKSNSHVQTEGSLNDNSNFAANSNVLNLTQEMNQQGINRYQVVSEKKIMHDICGNFRGNGNMCPPGIKYLLEQQQETLVSNSGGHEALDETISNYLGNQANASILVRNSMLLRDPPVAHNGDAADQSVQTSLPILAGRVPPSLAVPTSDTHESAYPQEMTHTKGTGTVPSLVKSSGRHSPVVETRSGSQSNISGMSQQAGFSKMLHHVWANLSAQQRLAGLQPHRVASNILQSIINHDRDASSWGLQMADSRGNQEENAPTEVGSSLINSQDRDHQTMGNFFKPKHAETTDGALSATTPQGLEPISSFSCRDSNVSFPSSVQHHQDIDTEKSGESSGFHPQVVHFPPTNTAPCRGDDCFSAHISVPSDSQQQNYSLLHQMQAIKDADSDSSMTLGKRLKGASISSNASNMEQRAGQIFVHRQNELFRVPTDGKQSSFLSDVRTLSFALKDNKRHTQMSSVAEHHDLHDHMHSPDTSSSASLISGNEHYRSSPQMTLSLFEKYMTYKNDMAIAKHDGDHFCGSMESSPIVEQITDSSKFGSIKQSTFASAMAANESSAFSLPSTVMDHNVGLRSKKRKSTTSKLLPWHKEISQGLQRLHKKASTLDVRLEGQELERFSIVNRLVKFHGRSQTNAVGGSSAYEAAPRRTFPQQYVTAHSMPEKFPDAALCISL
ncbi:hypothetical protein BHE74_00020256 [Ensete ventricosum]|nr:hypothetical protein GW17_00017877 [Ensete ventricosum]RWW71965.1 hypothetical protein BHE74_00020256 [Ensete ventricosum]RZR87407.1 hypothetical protein BHM03_00014857 [Ensete ventricosum]